MGHSTHEKLGYNPLSPKVGSLVAVLQTAKMMIDTHHHFVPDFYAQGKGPRGSRDIQNHTDTRA